MEARSRVQGHSRSSVHDELTPCYRTCCPKKEKRILENGFFRKHVLVPNKPIWPEITLTFVQEKVSMGNNKGHKTTFPHTFCPAPQCLPRPSSPLPDSPLASWPFHHRWPPVSWSHRQPTGKSWVILNLGLAACWATFHTVLTAPGCTTGLTASDKW